jgi:hypothetical protein
VPDSPDLPDRLDARRHRDLEGRRGYPWVRRAILLALTAVAAAALLNLFGQRPSTSRAGGPDAVLEVRAPEHLRGGLIFQARFDVTARRRLKEPTLVLQSGWFESMSVNSIEPSPSKEESRNGTVRLTFEPVEAGDTMTAWIYFQVNPTNVGRRSQDAEIQDGQQVLAAVHRSVTVLP